MDKVQILIAISAVLAFISPIIYAVSIYQGRTKPHRVTRFVVFFAAAISFFSLQGNESEIAVWLAGVFAVRGFFLFAISLHKGVGGRSRIDIISLALACIGIILWAITAEPLWALFFAISADFIGFVPALIKTYKDPWSEGPWFYYLEAVAVLCVIFAIGEWSIDLAFPLHILISIFFMLALIHRRSFLDKSE